MINDPVLNALSFALTVLAGAIGLVSWGFVGLVIMEGVWEVWSKVRAPKGREG